MPEIHALKTDQPLALPGEPQPSVDDVTRRLYEAAQPSIVKVETTKDGGVGVGTGFAVTRPGLIATDYHCVAGAKEIKVRLPNGDFHRARIKDIDDINDLAILELEGTPPPSLKPLPLGDSSKIAPDTRITALGHPEGLSPVYVSPGYHVTDVRFGNKLFGNLFGVTPENYLAKDTLTPKDREDAKAVIERQLMYTRVHIRPGNSGGPLLNNEGKVVGICDITADPEKFSHSLFTPVSDLNKLLNREKPKFQASYAYTGEAWTDSYRGALTNSPVFTATGTGLLAGGAYLGLARSSYARAAGVWGGAAYGALSLPEDAQELCNSTNTRDKLKYGTASLGDLSMLTGGAMRLGARPLESLMMRSAAQEGSLLSSLALRGAESTLVKSTLSKAGRVGVALLAVGAAVKIGSDFIPNRLVQTDLSRTDTNDIRPPFPLYGRH
ncbi:MAG: serine protease [Candidatus Obscuribacterales bacterium]|nr:serine protease [Candidatus Obscuribacterales bacterium]